MKLFVWFIAILLSSCASKGIQPQRGKLDDAFWRSVFQEIDNDR